MGRRRAIKNASAIFFFNKMHKSKTKWNPKVSNRPKLGEKKSTFSFKLNYVNLNVQIAERPQNEIISRKHEKKLFGTHKSNGK